MSRPADPQVPVVVDRTTPRGRIDLILRAGGVIVELTGLDRIDFDPFVSVFPLKLTGADGSPTRAVAMDLAAG